jgi:phage terminase large subunit-like protein
VTVYARAVVDGSVIAGPHVRDTCARHLRDLKDGARRGLRWNPALANRVCEFYPDVLRLAGGKHEGQPFHLHDWQAFVVGSLMGWQKGEARRFRIAYIETGKGSGKSPLGAGLGVYCSVADGEARSEGYFAAVDKDQAAIPFKDAVAMIRLSDELSAEFAFSGGINREFNAAHLPSGSFLRPISSEAQGRGKSGYRPHFVLLDEVHEHPTPAMVEFMIKGTKNRVQPLVVMITNSGVDRTSVCFDYHTYGAKVAAGEIEDDSFFSYICAVDEKDDPFTDPIDPDLGYPRSWAKANPSIGVTFQPDYLEREMTRARGHAVAGVGDAPLELLPVGGRVVAVDRW